jgi:hypothetical protein
MTETREKYEKEAFDIKVATYASDPERYAETVFPEWYPEQTVTDLDSLDQYENVVYDLEADDEMMTPAKMERMLEMFE